MMPVIRISDNTMEKLQKFAVPLVDTPDSVIQRLIEMVEGNSSNEVNPKRSEPAPKRKSKDEGPKTPQKVFKDYVLKAVFELGGVDRVENIRSRLFETMKSQLLEGDFTIVSSGDPRWWNAACWARNELREDGLISADSPRGVWELTEAGRTRAMSLCGS